MLEGWQISCRGPTAHSFSFACGLRRNFVSNRNRDIEVALARRCADLDLDAVQNKQIAFENKQSGHWTYRFIFETKVSFDGRRLMYEKYCAIWLPYITILNLT